MSAAPPPALSGVSIAAQIAAKAYPRDWMPCPNNCGGICRTLATRCLSCLRRDQQETSYTPEQRRQRSREASRRWFVKQDRSASALRKKKPCPGGCGGECYATSRMCRTCSHDARYGRTQLDGRRG